MWVSALALLGSQTSGHAFHARIFGFPLGGVGSILFKSLPTKQGKKFNVQRAYLITEIQFGSKHRISSDAREK